MAAAQAVVAAEEVRLEALLPLPVLLQGEERLPLPVLLPLLAQLLLEAELAGEELLLHRSFSAATVRSLTSMGIPLYAPVLRSRRKPNSRP